MRLRLALRILWGLCCLLLLLVNTGDYVQFTKHPELYPIGGEGLGWTYESHENYALACLLAIVWDIVGIIASACHRFRYSGKNPADTCCFDADYNSLFPNLHDHLWDIGCYFIAIAGQTARIFQVKNMLTNISVLYGNSYFRI